MKCLYQHNPKVRENSEISSPSPREPTNVDFVPGCFKPMHGCRASNFPPIYFVDSGLYQKTFTEIPKVVTTVQKELQDWTEDIREQAQTYFRTIHPWIPFLSRKLFSERLLNPLTPRDADVTLLFACIKLVCSLPNGESMCTNAHATIRRSLLEAEISGVLSVRMLYAWILICLYELGHAIYPAAYLSIGVCTRYASALGLSKDNKHMKLQSSDWIEAEEIRRAQWAIFILDWCALADSSSSLTLAVPTSFLLKAPSELLTYIPQFLESFLSSSYIVNWRS